MSVILRKRKNSDGSTSLLLDIYDRGVRRYEFLKHLKLSKPSNEMDRQKNKENFQLAKKIEVKRAQELSANDYSMITETGKNTIVTEWMQVFIDNYKKKDKRNLQGALNRFKKFLIEEKKHGLTFGHLSELIIADYQDYLRGLSVGEGAASYFARFKKMVKQAYRQKLLSNNPAADVKTKAGKARKKDILSLQEIQKLAETPTDSSEVRRAFLFTCMTGLRWIEIKNLKWGHINFSNKRMNVMQSKTEREKTVPLNEAAIKLLGSPGADGAFVFHLPTANGANKALKAWVKRAGMKYKITWHNGRHSAGTNMAMNSGDIKTISSVLGHSTLRHTERYIREAEILKQRATESLNIEV